MACKAITRASGGRLEVRPFVGGSVVPAYKEVDAIDQNVLQMAYTCPMYNLDKWKAAGLISSRPGGLPGEALRSWFDYAGGAELMNKMMDGYNVMTFRGALSPLPAEVFFHSKVRLDSMADIKGLKARCMGDGGEILKRMGAATVIIPGGELYEAMQRGTIDAFEYSTLASNWTMHFNEVAKYVYLSPTRGAQRSAGVLREQGCLGRAAGRSQGHRRVRRRQVLAGTARISRGRIPEGSSTSSAARATRCCAFRRTSTRRCSPKRTSSTKRSPSPRNRSSVKSTIR